MGKLFISAAAKSAAAKRKKSNNKSVRPKCLGEALLAPLVDVIHASGNPDAAQSACEILSTSALIAQAENAMDLLDYTSRRGMNTMQTLVGVINAANPDSCECATRALANYARHPQWRPFLCGYDIVPTLVGMLSKSVASGQDESIRANALAALING